MSRKVNVHIQGYGDVVVKRPRELDAESFSDIIAETVAKTMNLVAPSNKPEWIFHPVYGVVKNDT